MSLGTLKDKLVPVFLFIIAGVIVFFIFNQSSKTRETVSIPVITKDLAAGVQVKDSDIGMKEIGKFNLDSGIIQKKGDIVGKYVRHDLYKGRFVYGSDITAETIKTSIIHKIKYGAVSFNTNLTKAVGGLPKPGDWVEVRIVRNNPDTKRLEVLNYDELQAIKLISIQNAAGEKVVQDKEKDKSVVSVPVGDSVEKPAIVTFDARPEQVDALLEGEYGGQLHMILIPAANQDDKYQEKLMPDRLKRADERKKKEQAALNALAAKSQQFSVPGGGAVETKH